MDRSLLLIISVSAVVALLMPALAFAGTWQECCSSCPYKPGSSLTLGGVKFYCCSTGWQTGPCDDCEDENRCEYYGGEAYMCNYDYLYKGTCRYNFDSDSCLEGGHWSFYENCEPRVEDTDGGLKYTVAGMCTDYNGCSYNFCQKTGGSDCCMSDCGGICSGISKQDRVCSENCGLGLAYGFCYIDDYGNCRSVNLGCANQYTESDCVNNECTWTPGSSDELIEYYTSGSSCTSHIVNCKDVYGSGSSCVNGACTQSTVKITIDSNPRGDGFVAVGNRITTPETYEWDIGSTHTISAKDIFCPEGPGYSCRYNFISWSDGGDRTHTITVPSYDTTYTANFQKQYYLTMGVNPSDSGEVTPDSGWRNAGTTVQITASPSSDYTFFKWSGSGDGSYTGEEKIASVTMSAPITQTAQFNQINRVLTVDSRIDVLDTQIDGVGIRVDGVTKTTLGGQVTYELTPGSHSILASTLINGREFSHFWDHDSNADCDSNDYDTSSNPYTFSMPSCGKEITAWYKVFTQISGLGHDGTTIFGYLKNEAGYPLISRDSGEVRLSYYDGRWKNIGTVYASPDTGKFSYSFSLPSATTKIKAEYVPDTWYYMGSSAESDYCVNECSSGDKRCYDGNVQTCSNYDSDTCLEWGGYSACPSGQICSEGQCIDHMVSITIESSPTGHNYVTADNQLIVTPKTYSWKVGTTHTISANSYVSCGDSCRYSFTSWSDGGNRKHTITVPSYDRTYTANFQKQYYLTMGVNPSDSGEVTPDSGWNNASTTVQITASPDSEYTFYSWTGFGANGSYTGEERIASVYINGPISQTAQFNQINRVLTVDSRIDVLDTQIDGVGIRVDGVTKTTLGGQVTYELTPGSHSILASTLINGREFSHFWDHDSNADCVPNDADTASNPYTFSMPSCGKTITAWYKALTSISNFEYDGSTISGNLLNEKNNPLLAVEGRRVTLSYYDGTWHTLGTATASTSNGYFSYSFPSCSASVTQMKAEFVPTTWYYNRSSSKINVDCGCSLDSVTIIPNCRGGVSSDCETGESVNMLGTYSGYCTGADFFQIDAYGDGCDIQYMDGDMSGIWDSSITLSSGTVSGSWVIPQVPLSCEGKTVEPTYSTLRDGGATGSVVSGTWDAIGSIKFHNVCRCGEWSAIGCGAGGCTQSQMYQSRTCTPSGCALESQCSGPSYSEWSIIGCGGQCGSTTCSLTQECQKRVDTYGCAADEYRCSDSSYCKSYSMQIYIGWNLISSPISEITGVAEDTCGAAGGNFYYYDRDTSQWVVDTVGIKNLKPGVGYWFYSEKNCNVKISGSGNIESNDIKISSGWNHIASPSAGMTDTSQLRTGCSDLKVLWYNPVSQSFEETTALQPGKGYNVQCIS